MGRADVLLGFSGLHIAAAVMLGLAAMWIGRREIALIDVGAVNRPLASRVASDALPTWKLWVLAVRRVFLPAELALFGLVLGWPGLLAAVAIAWFMRRQAIRRAAVALYLGKGRDPADGFQGFAAWAAAEAAVVIGGYLTALTASIFLEV